MNLIPIESLTDPLIAEYANIRDSELSQRTDPLNPDGHHGLFIAEGELVFDRLIHSAYPTKSVLLTPNRLETVRSKLDLLPTSTPIYLVAQAALNEIVGFNMHRGLLAIGLRTRPHTFVDFLSLAGPLIILEDLTNHDNLGGIFRNAAALGGPGCAVLLSPRCADPLYRKALRVSMGNVLTVPFARLQNWPAPLQQLRNAGWTIAALSPDHSAEDLPSAAARLANTRVALILGSEGPGLTSAAESSSDIRVRIPMRPLSTGETIDSLNVAMAAGLALYKFGRG